MKSSDDHIFFMMKLPLMITAVYHFWNCWWFLVFTIAANSCMIRSLHNLIEGPNFFHDRPFYRISCEIFWLIFGNMTHEWNVFVFLTNHASEIRCKSGCILSYLPVELEPIEINEFNWSSKPSLYQVEYRTLRQNDQRR